MANNIKTATNFMKAGTKIEPGFYSL